MDQADSVKPIAEVKASFPKGGAFGTQLVEEIATCADEAQADRLDESLRCSRRCSNVTRVEAGKRAPVTVSGLSFPNLGGPDARPALTFKAEGIEAVADAVFIAVGTTWSR